MARSDNKDKARDKSRGGGGSPLAGVTPRQGSISSRAAQEAVADEPPASKPSAEEPPAEEPSADETSAEESSAEESSAEAMESGRGGDDRKEEDLPLGVDLATVSEVEDGLQEKNISFSISEQLYRRLQKRLLKERISMRRALTGVMRWWTEEPAAASDLLRPQIQVVRERKEESSAGESAGDGSFEGAGSASKGSSFRVDEDLHNDFRVQLIDEDLYVKDAAEVMVRWFAHEPAQVRSRIRPHLPPKRR